jgi:hypothetical protein
MSLFDAQSQAKSKARRELSKDAKAIVASMSLKATGSDLDKITSRVAEMPQICRLTYLKAMQGDSPTSGIKAFCAMCMGWEDYRAGVRDCTDTACPIYPYRPYQVGVDDSDELEA